MYFGFFIFSSNNNSSYLITLPFCVCVCVCPFQPLNKLPDFHKTRYEHDANEEHHNAGITDFLKLVKAERRKYKFVMWGRLYRHFL